MKSNVNWWSLSGTLLALFLATAAHAQSPTIQTDKSNYLPGEIVTLTGTGWMSGETVTMVLHEDTFVSGDRTLTSVADAAGAFSNMSLVLQSSDFGISFTVNATGSVSGWTAQAQFADGGLPQDPLPQALPYCQDFSSLAWSSGCLNNLTPSCATENMPPGWEGWSLGSGTTNAFSTSVPVLDLNLFFGSSAGPLIPGALDREVVGGIHNYDGKIGFLPSAATNASLVLALNTVGKTNIPMQFDIMTIRNPWSGELSPPCANPGLQGIRINQVDLQYHRVGVDPPSLWQSVSNNPGGIYESAPGPNKVGYGDTSPQNLQTVTLLLPPECENQPNLQLRWVRRDMPSQCGPRPSFAIDNVKVNNPAPIATITGPVSGTASPVNTGVTFTGTFTDNPGETHTALWYFDGVPAGDPVTITGDGTGSGTISMTHVFTTAGVYMVSLRVTDQCGGTGTANQVDGVDAMVVVYDPNAGFVTGGGWIDSPPGAYAPDPTLTGKANFGFVSKYQRGKSIPTGETEFQFRVADLNLHSASYDWLVIAGAKAQYKGVGTINGAGDYGFMLTATDGNLKDVYEPDKYRIKITDRGTGAVVYDNQMGATDGSDPTTELGGGSIVIRTTSGGKQVPAAAVTPAVAVASPPVAYALYPNQPNPFQKSTTIGFDLPEAGRVSLTIYSVAGRVVRTLTNQEWPAGRHELVWTGEADDGARIATGVYFYRITVQPAEGGAPFTSLKRMTLLK